jgi:Ca-activated chloride channel family protein
MSNRDGRRVATVRGDARDVTLLVPTRRGSSAAISMLPFSPGNEEGFALVTVTPPLMNRGETTPRDITLVLDISGSMQGRKIEQARAAGRQLLGTLRPEDRFRLVDFASDVRTFRDEFVSATTANLRAATRYLEALEAQGSTNIEGALREAVRVPTTAGRLPLILFMTDGEATVGERRADRLAMIGADAASRTGGAQRRIFTFGLGADVNVTLLEQLAVEGRGSAEFVRPDESVERMVGVVANRLVDPLLTDVRVFVEGGVRLSKMLPAQPSDVFSDRDLVILARYSGHGSARVVVEGMRRSTPVRWTTTVDFPDRERQNPFVARLWAAQRVGLLSADKRRNGGSVEVDDEIRMLGERYGIPTEFTSYLVVEPQLAMARRASLSGAGQQQQQGQQQASPPASVAADRDLRFEAAKAASAQRSANSVAMLDSMSAKSELRKESDATTRRIESRTFTLNGGVWTDARYRAGMTTIKIKPFSTVYFDLMKELPDLRAAFALGDRVIVVGRDRAIQLADDGVESMSAHALSALTKAW